MMRQGVAGAGGAAVISDAMVDEGSITGGGGGGGGNVGGYRYGYDYENTKGTVTYSYKTFYSYGTGVAGGGGGGGFLVVANGKITVSGTIDVSGGAGSEYLSGSTTYVAYGNGAGGGGGGGNVCLKAKNGFDVKGTIDASGGEGGVVHYKYTSSTSYDYGDNIYSKGGEGGTGAITLIAGAGKEPDIVNAGNTDIGDSGSVTTGKFSSTKDGISKWYDTGVTAPAFTSAVAQGSAIATVRVMAAMADPATGGADESTSTGWMELADLSKLNGYRFVRFWVELEGTSVPGKAPEVDRVVVSWTSKK
jgi:hypothetical protein